jgi:perosamine synthetase
MKNKFYPIAKPFFSKREIQTILNQFKIILEGNGLMSMGPYVKKFENMFIEKFKSKFAVTTSSCTSALEISINSLNLSKGDEIIIPSQTFIATASSVLRNNLKLRVCEINKNFQLDFESLKKMITKKTKAVIIVHYSGYIDDNIFNIKKYLTIKKIKLIEDCAHAIGAQKKGVYAGNIGDIGCFSFYSTKNLTTGEGGMITCNNKNIYEKIRSYRSRGLNYKSKVEEYSSIGTNSRMTEFQAILGIQQMKRLNGITKERNKLAANYDNILFNQMRLKKIESFFKDKVKDKKNIYSFWKFPVRIVSKINRSKLQSEMKKKGISIDWAYSPLIHKQKAIKDIIGNIKLKNSENYSKQFFCLPMYLGLSLSDQMHICKTLAQIINEKN